MIVPLCKDIVCYAESIEKVRILLFGIFLLRKKPLAAIPRPCREYLTALKRLQNLAGFSAQIQKRGMPRF